MRESSPRNPLNATVWTRGGGTTGNLTVVLTLTHCSRDGHSRVLAQGTLSELSPRRTCDFLGPLGNHILGERRHLGASIPREHETHAACSRQGLVDDLEGDDRTWVASCENQEDMMIRCVPRWLGGRGYGDTMRAALAWRQG